MEQLPFLSISQLFYLQDVVDDSFVNGTIDAREYDETWTYLLSLAHLTREGYEDVVDASWHVLQGDASRTNRVLN